MARFRLAAFVLVVAALVPRGAAAQSYRMVQQDLDARRHGVTVLHVWGTHEEMGFAIGAALAEDLVEAFAQVRRYLGAGYSMTRTAATALTWPDPAVEAEMDAIVDGILSVVPDAPIDGTDLRIVNALSDLAYTACRSHSAWGRYVEDPVRTLSTRRFDYSALVDFMHHHVLVAMEPEQGTRWLNVGWGSIVTAITAVNEHGTVTGLHDLGRADLFLAAPVSRAAAARAILTGVGDRPVSEHASWAAEQIGDWQVATDTFILYYVPEGLGGFFTCRNQLCTLLRPQDDFLFGEAIITTNAVTDGHSTPGGGGWLADFYQGGAPKDLASHWEVTQPSFHRLSVEVRGRGDMTLWFDGELRSGLTDRVELEWQDLFHQPTSGGDGDGDADADADADLDADPDGDADGGSDDDPPDGDGGGCSGGCATAPSRASGLTALLVRALVP